MPPEPTITAGSTPAAGRRGPGAEVDDPPGGVAVEPGAGPAQHLDVPDGVEVEVVELRLAVRHGQGHVVDQHADAAHAEAGAAADAADRDAVPLRQVAAVAHGDAGQLPQGFVEGDPGFPAEGAGPEPVDAERDLLQRRRHPGGGDLHLGKLDGGR